MRRLVLARAARTAGCSTPGPSTATERGRVRRAVPARQVRRRPAVRLRAPAAGGPGDARPAAGRPGPAARPLRRADDDRRQPAPRRDDRPVDADACPRPFRVLGPPAGHRRHRHPAARAGRRRRAWRSSPASSRCSAALGVGEVPISISGDPAEPAAAAAHRTRRRRGDPRPGARPSRASCSTCADPYGTGWTCSTTAGAATSSLVAGGIGLAPLRPAVLERARRPRTVTAASSSALRRAQPRRTCCTGDELEPWRRAGVDVAGHRRPRAARLARPRRAGHHAASRGPASTRPGPLALVCGPEVMMRYVSGRPRRPRRGARADPAVDGAQHEVRRRPVRPLPAARAVRLRRRSGARPTTGSPPLLRVREV